MTSMRDYRPMHFRWSLSDGVGTVTLNRPERKNPLTFDSYAELRDCFQALRGASDVRTVVVTGAGGNFCSGGDVHEIIGPLVGRDTPGLLDFTRMTGALVKAMRGCPQPIIAAIEGVCVGAGAAIAMACDTRVGAAGSWVGFLFVRIGLAGCDMGACAMLPRIVGFGRAAELLFTGRMMEAEEAERWGFYNRLCSAGTALDEAMSLARQLARGPTFAHMMTKTMLDREWDMALDAAIDAEAEAQAICMQTKDFERAFRVFVEKREPVFEGD